MINLQIGADEGYIDYILIQSKEPIKRRIRENSEKHTTIYNGL